MLFFKSMLLNEIHWAINICMILKVTCGADIFRLEKLLCGNRGKIALRRINCCKRIMLLKLYLKLVKETEKYS